MCVLIRISNHLSRQSKNCFQSDNHSAPTIVLTRAAVTKKIKLVIGGPGQYNRAKKKNGKQTAKTVAKQQGLPCPSPVDTYLRYFSCYHSYIRQITNHMARPTRPPKNVLIIRSTNPKAVSPRNREMVSWPMKLCQGMHQYQTISREKGAHTAQTNF